MKTFEEQIIHFNSIKPDEKNEQFEKVEIIVDLEHLPDKRILPFFLERVVDIDEYDLARIEIVKILAVRHNQPDEYKRIAKAMQTLLEQPDDSLVKEWVAQESSRYVQDDNLFKALLKVIVDTNEYVGVRHNALLAAERRGKNDEMMKALEMVKDDPEDENYDISFIEAVKKLLEEFQK